MPEPTITDYLEIARRAVILQDRVADWNRGSDYESLAGPNAILWSRQSQRDVDLWKATRYGDAQGPDLTRAGEGRFGIARILDTRGVGTAVLTRPSLAGGPGTIWKGTRIRVHAGPLGTPVYYRVTSNTAVDQDQLQVTVPIEAVKFGPGSKIDTHLDCYVDDILWDTWQVAHLVCTDGTRLESGPEYRARIRRERQAARVGHRAAIIETCIRAGAGRVELFQSDYAGFDVDHGLNYVYVGGLSYNSTPQLVRDCTLALRSTRVAGDNLQVLPMARSVLQIDVDIYLRDHPYVLPIEHLEVLHRRALIQYMDGANGAFTYTLAGLESAIAKVGTEVQDVRFVTPSADAGVLKDGSFPEILTRHFAEDGSITIRYHGPE